MMKVVLLYIGILTMGCSAPENAPQLRNGDLLFVVGKESQMSSAITAATATEEQLNYTHVGIALAGDRSDSVLEATSEGGVRVVALPVFLQDAAKSSGRPLVVAKRLRDTSGVSSAVSRARSHLGEPYDYSYRPDNGKMYCSELVWASYLTQEGAHRFCAHPMNFRAPDGTLPDFWRDLFEQLGEPVPEGIPGTNPNDMARDTLLVEVGRWF